MKNAFKTAFIVCSSLIGAGFASGREIMEFFPAGRGFAPAVAAILLISVFVYVVLKTKGQICDYLLYRFGVSMFSVCVLSVMIAAADEIMPLGRAFMTLITLLTVVFGMRGVESMSVMLCPAMILFILLFGLEKTYGVCLCDVEIRPDLNAFLYAGYNVFSFPVLLRYSECKKPFLASVVVFLVMMSLMTVVYAASSLYPDATMPFVRATGGGFFVGLMLMSALYTTAVCSAFCICDIMGGGKITAIIISVIAFVCSYSGFGQLISNGYRTFGFAGLLAVLWEFILHQRLDFKRK